MPSGLTVDAQGVAPGPNLRARISCIARRTIARNGDQAIALQLLERATEVAPEDVSVLFQLGSLLDAQGRSGDALAQFERCTLLAPEFSDGWIQLRLLQAHAVSELAWL